MMRIRHKNLFIRAGQIFISRNIYLSIYVTQNYIEMYELG